jgi:hypothetical protein
MKVPMIALALALASATTVSAYAANPAVQHDASETVQQAAQWSPAQSAPKAKTRAEVRQELVRAQNDGQLAALNKLYQGS